MDQKDRLAYEVAMAMLQDTREDCLRWLDDQKPAATRRSVSLVELRFTSNLVEAAAGILRGANATRGEP
jgi:hypothetical protein